MIRRSERGFSLIEVLLVLGLVLVLSSIAAPRLAEFWKFYQMEALARKTANLVLTARREAARSNRRTSIIWNWDPVDWYYIGIDTNRNNFVDPGEPRITYPRNGYPILWMSGFGIPHPDYVQVLGMTDFTLPYRYRFGPDGTLQVPALGGGFQMDTSIRNISIIQWDSKRYYWYIIAITPSGQTRTWHRDLDWATGQWTPWQAL